MSRFGYQVWRKLGNVLGGVHVTNWILTTGFWDDFAFWFDDQVWKDS